MLKLIAALLFGLPLLVVLLAAVVRWPAAPVVPTAGMKNSALSFFPELQGRDIDGRPYTVPGDLAGDYNLVLLAFDQYQQASVNAWLEPLRPLETTYPLRVYELPTVPNLSWLERTQLDFWMSAGIPDSRARATTITLYTDVAAVQRALRFENTATIQIFLIDKVGRVYWHGADDYTTAQYDDLITVLQNLPEAKVQ